MDYSKIRVLQMQKNLSDRKFAESIGLSGPGYKSMLEEQTCTVEKLELICSLYKVPITHFFSSELLTADEGPIIYQTKKQLTRDELVEFLKEELKAKDEKINQLNRELGKLDASRDEKAG